LVTRLDSTQMNIIASNSTNFEMVVTGVMRRKKIVETASYIWTEVMGRNATDCRKVKITRGGR